MKLTTLAFKSIRHNLRNYAMYFFAMCFCVFTTYTFAAIATSESVKQKIHTDGNYQSMFIGFGIVILVFIFFFLLSSNKSFIKYRKKEISTYALFGMPNGKIGRLLFLETLIIGTAALVIGILLGIFFSKLIAMLLLKMIMAAYSGDICFTIEPIAILVTAAVFMATFLCMGLSGRRVINKFQLVDLFKGEKVSEGKTKGSVIMLVLSVLLIGLGYVIALLPEAGVVFGLMIGVIAVVVIGTYLFFRGGLQKVLSLMKRNKNRLYKRKRLVTVSLLAHKSKTMAGTMGTIAVLVAVSTTAIAFGHTIYKSTEKNIYETSSFDVWYYTDDQAVDGDIKAVLENEGLDITDEVHFQRYVCSPTVTDSEYMQFLQGETDLMTYSESTYRTITQAAKDSNTPIDVKQGEAALLYPNGVQGDQVALKIGGRQLDATVMKIINTYSYGGMLMTVVLDDSDFDDLRASGAINADNLWPFTGINYENALSDDAAAQAIARTLDNRTGSFRLAYNSHIELISIFGLICFIGYFICAVFILMSASMLYFKQVVIGIEERRQYQMLRKIGMSEDEEKRIVRGRLVPVFFLPLFMGIVHSLFAMKAADTLVFSNMIISKGPSYLTVLWASLAMYAVYSVVYAVFYLVTKSQYKRAIR